MQAFLEQDWQPMKEAAEEGGGLAVIAFIEGFKSGPKRRLLYTFARQGLVMQEWRGKDFDDYIAVCDAGIAEMLAQAKAAPNNETRGQCMRGAHVVSYNLAADLADCWPGDDAPRSREHHERGIKAADDCLTWIQAAGDSEPISKDWWVRGIHQLSLGDTGGAEASWTKALEFAEQAGGADDMGVVLNSGYLGLARWNIGRDGDRAQYDEALAALKSKLKDDGQAEAARMCIAQLEKVREMRVA